MKITKLFCEVDDFCKKFYPSWKKRQIGGKKNARKRKFSLSPSEVMTSVILFHQSNYRDFKHFYEEKVLSSLQVYFPKRVSYSRFLQLKASILEPLCCFLSSRKGQQTGINYIDSTSIKVCHNRRIQRNKVF